MLILFASAFRTTVLEETVISSLLKFKEEKIFVLEILIFEKLDLS